MNDKRNPLLVRLALAIPETRRELGLSLTELSRFTGVSRASLSKLERGERVRADLIVRAGVTLLVLELHRPPVQPVNEMQLALLRKVPA